MNIALIITLLVVGLVLILLEIFVVPGFGVSGILGIVALVAGCFFSFEFGVTYGLVTTGVVLLVIIILLCIALRSKTWKRLALNTKVDSTAGQDSQLASPGDKGCTTTRLAPMGMARINGKTMEVKSVHGMMDAGCRIEVTSIEDNIIYVDKDE